MTSWLVRLWIAIWLALVSSPALTADAMSAAPIVAKLETQSESGFVEQGAGILLGYSRTKLFIATAAHLLYPGNEQAKSAKVRFSFYDVPYAASTFEQMDDEGFIPKPGDTGTDVAVLEVQMDDRLFALVTALNFDVLGDDHFIAYKDPLHIVGNPSGAGVSSAQDGRFQSRLGETIKFESTSIVRGHSGGGLFDQKWRLIGMVTQREPPVAEASRIKWIVAKYADKMTTYLKPAPHLEREVKPLVFSRPSGKDAQAFLTWIKGHSELPRGKGVNWLVAEVDLNADKVGEWIIQVAMQSACGSGGCEWIYGVFARDGEAFKVLAELECGTEIWMRAQAEPGAFARLYCQGFRDYFATEIESGEHLVMEWGADGYGQLTGPIDISEYLGTDRTDSAVDSIIDPDPVSVTGPPLREQTGPEVPSSPK